MRVLWLTSAALLAASAVPASADAPADRNFGIGSGVDIHRGEDHGRRRGPAVIFDFGRGGEWAYANNRSFEPDSYNDWWHDRPDRAYPRWMQNNDGCQRRWWSGGGWRC